MPRRQRRAAGAGRDRAAEEALAGRRVGVRDGEERGDGVRGVGQDGGGGVRRDAHRLEALGGLDERRQRRVRVGRRGVAGLGEAAQPGWDGRAGPSCRPGPLRPAGPPGSPVVQASAAARARPASPPLRSCSRARAVRPAAAMRTPTAIARRSAASRSAVGRCTSPASAARRAAPRPRRGRSPSGRRHRRRRRRRRTSSARPPGRSAGAGRRPRGTPAAAASDGRRRRGGGWRAR